MHLDPLIALTRYIEQPRGVLRFSSLKMHSLELRDVVIDGREAGINLQALVHDEFERHETIRARRKAVRYALPLPPDTPARLLSKEIKEYLEFVKATMKRPTYKAAKQSLKVLRRVCGEILVSKITHAHIYSMWDLLRWAPDRYMSKASLVDLGIEDLIAMGREQGRKAPSDQTIDAHFFALSGFFRKLESVGAIAHSPMEIVKRKKTVKAQNANERSQVWTDDELRKLFDPDTLGSWAKTPHCWFIPMLLLYTGARVGELAQLKTQDVVFDHGYWCLHIRATKDEDFVTDGYGQSSQTVKSEHSIRLIPIAQAVIDAGFLTFVEDIKRHGHARLFPNLSPGYDRKTKESLCNYSTGYIQKFAKYRDGLGIDPGIASHGFRHTFSTVLAQAGVSDAHICLLTGHKNTENTSTNARFYTHLNDAEIRKLQWETLAKFQAPVQLLPYKEGMFDAKLGPTAKVYP